jgi:hypothetical protein
MRIYNRDIFNTEESGGEDPGLTLLRGRSLEVSEMAKVFLKLTNKLLLDV